MFFPAFKLGDDLYEDPYMQEICGIHFRDVKLVRFSNLNFILIRTSFKPMVE